MMNLTLGEAAAAVKGRFFGTEEEKKIRIGGVVIDSRQAKQGDLFLAIRGERSDGHRYIPDVFEKGAAAVFSEEVLTDAKGPYVLVESSEQALKDLAEYYRSTLTIPVVGITGSVGKTSTKEMIASVLSQKFHVLKTEGNFNNEIGMPLTLLRIRPEHEAAVIEMGIDSFGEMHRLAKVARPDICVMTNIGPCHLENLGDLDGVLRAKSEIFDFLTPDAAIVLNGNDPKLSLIGEPGGVKPMRYYVEDETAESAAAEAREAENSGYTAADAWEAENSGHTAADAREAENSGHTAADAREAENSGDAVVEAREAENPGGTEAEGASFTIRAEKITDLGFQGMEADLVFPDGTVRVTEPLPGIHNLYNACAAACVALRLGLTKKEILAGIASVRTIAGRSNRIALRDNILLIDDCYNANPVSMRASLNVLASAPGRKIAVLGDMGELGAEERELHAQVGAFVKEKQIDLLFCTGDLSEALAESARGGRTAVLYYPEKEELTEDLMRHILPGDTILVKASHFMNFPEIVDRIREAYS